jgi:hypothetical protein
MTPVYQVTGNAAGNAISDRSVVMFNSAYKWTGQLMNHDTAAITGLAIAQNVWERITSAISPAEEIQDTSTANGYNITMQYETVAGARADQLYNYTGANYPLYFFDNSYLGMIWENYNYNGDQSPPANATHSGAMSVDYSVGQIGNLKAQTQTAGFEGVFIGTSSVFGAGTPSTAAKPQWVTDASFNDGLGGSNAGNGDYRLKSNSPAKNLVPATRCALPYDLAGSIRNCSGYGSAGAFEQAIINTTPFSW